MALSGCDFKKQNLEKNINQHSENKEEIVWQEKIMK